ncbi:MAG: GIY-YIG nuclease family protein, partial [Chloroflexota bacterium]
MSWHSSSDSFPVLLERALTYVREHGPATPAELGQAVFGGPGFASMLGPLEASGRLRFDGRMWRLPDQRNEWAVLQILTSGPNPQRHRVVECAALRDGRRYHALLASDLPTPRPLARLGVPSLEDGTPPERVREHLREMLRGTTVVGFDLRPAFVDQLLGPAWPAIDLLRLIYEVHGFPARPDPAAVAAWFRIEPPRDRRPVTLAKLSQALFERLLQSRTFENLRELGAPTEHPARQKPEPPAQPGVYIMSSNRGEALYVGKSRNLKRRVASYLGSPIAESRGLYHLLPATRTIEIIPVSTEVEAILLESRLIAELVPVFNIQRRSRPRRCYLRLSTADPFPRLTMVAEPSADGHTYFGPLGSQ